MEVEHELGIEANGGAVRKWLDRGRGQWVTIRVVDGGDGPPLDQRPERTITFEVPAAP